MHETCKFRESLAFGQIAEKEFKDILEEEGWEVIQSEGKKSDYDLLATKDGKTITYEMKTDRKAIYTCNVPIEFSKTAHNKTEQCGVNSSKADYYVFKLEFNHHFYVIATDKLKQLISDENFKIKTKGGDGMRTEMYLMDKDVLISNCDKVKRKSVPELSALRKTINSMRNKLIKQ